MKKYLLALVLLFLLGFLALSLPLRAQDVQQGFLASAAMTGPTLTIGPKVRYHRLRWTSIGAGALCRVQVDGAVSVETWVDAGVIVSTNCNLSGETALAAGTWNHVHIKVTNAGGGAINVMYLGYFNKPSDIGGGVNLSEVGGTAVLNGGVAGSQGVGGLAADGAAVAGNPLRMAGKDGGGLTQDILTDSTGLQLVGGAAADGVAVAGYPVRIAGKDSAGNTQDVVADSAGILGLVGSAASADAGTTNWGRFADGAGNYLSLGVRGAAYNGSAWDRLRSASLANFATSATLTARNSIGATIIEKGSHWSVIHNPAAGSQATASIAAEASVRHVVDCISFSGAAIVAPALTRLDVNLRDGATGAGTIIWSYTVAVAATTGQSVLPHSICGLNLVGTTNTAMTLEFSASLANLIENVSVSGYNVN